MSARLLSTSDLASYLAVSPATVRRMVKRGELPKPIKMGERVVRWDRAAIDACIDRLGRTTVYADPDQSWGGSHGKAA